MKHVFIFVAFSLIVVVTGFVYIESKSKSELFSVVFNLSSIDGLAQDESSWEGKKLKKVDCECPNGKKGITLKCKTNGDLKACTATQQGSNACYKVDVFSMKLLCEN